MLTFVLNTTKNDARLVFSDPVLPNCHADCLSNLLNMLETLRTINTSDILRQQVILSPSHNRKSRRKSQ